MGKRWDVGGWAACLPPIRADGSRGYVVHGPCSCPQDCVSDVVFVMHCECSVEAGPLSGFFSKELDLGWVEGRDAGAEQGRDSRWAHRREGSRGRAYAWGSLSVPGEGGGQTCSVLVWASFLQIRALLRALCRAARRPGVAWSLEGAGTVQATRSDVRSAGRWAGELVGDP